MSKKEYILFIVEGEKTEPQILKNLKQYFLKKKESRIEQDIVIAYGTVIYKLYREFFDKNNDIDEDLDLVTLLKPKDEEYEIKRDDVSQIYLFFDYDSHASNAKDEKLMAMLELFDDELDKGKLFVSYPMVEALRHIKRDTDFKNVVATSEKSYKKISQECDTPFLHFNDYSFENWKHLIAQHSKKANFIVNDKFEFPTNFIEQLTIFGNQKEKYINVDGKVAVLSAFPLMLLDYYGVSILEEN